MFAYELPLFSFVFLVYFLKFLIIIFFPLTALKLNGFYPDSVDFSAAITL